MNKKSREPLFHITKRGVIPWYAGWAIRAAALALALAICALLMVELTGATPGALFDTVYKGSFGGKENRKTWEMLQNLSLLLCVSLALTPAFRMRFWNVGGEGQILAGCMASAACMILLRGILPNWLIIVCMFATSMAAGAIWGGIPAFFKAKWGTNETLFTLMMNYIALQIVRSLCFVWEPKKGSGIVGVINQPTAKNPYPGVGWLPEIGGNKWLLGILIVAALCVIMYIYMNYSKHGYEISVVGESERTARYVGIKVERVIVRTMMLSGALCGLAGMLLVGGVHHTLSDTLTDNRGFTAVMVAWLAKFNPVWMILTSFLLVFLQKGAGQLQSTFGVNQSFSDIMTGIILFFIIGSEFFITYKINFRHFGRKAVEA